MNSPSQKLLKLAQITTTAGTQIRAKLDDDTVSQYAEDMQDADNKFPPVVVFHDGTDYVLADGFHRVMAATRNGFKDIEADVRKGGRSDALKFALGANAAHGLRRSNADKRRSVELALAEWPKLSDREIARICCVDHKTVSESRPKESTGEVPQLPTGRIGADGKERKMPAKRKVAPEPDEPPRVVAHTEVMPKTAPVAPPPPPSSSSPALGQALGGLQAGQVIAGFNAWLFAKCSSKEQCQWALRILADHIADAQRKLEAA